MYCKKCGKELREGARFCPACGTPTPSTQNKRGQRVSVTDKNGNEKTKLPVLVIVPGIAIVIAGAFLLFKAVLPLVGAQLQQEKETKTFTESEMETYTEIMTTESDSQTEETEIPIEADINGVDQLTVTVPGKITIVDKTWCLELDRPQSVYALNSGGNAQLMNNMTLLYLSSGVASDLDFNDYAEWTVNAKGSLSISDGKVYLIANEINTVSPPAVKAETVHEEAETRNYTGSADYILPDSNSRYLTASDLAGLSKHELMLARNEIYARRGRKFEDSELRSYFLSKSWYYPTIDADDFSADIFNDYERKNIEFIHSFE